MKLPKIAIMGFMALSLTACSNASNYCQEHPWVCILAVKATAVEVALITGAIGGGSL